MTNLAELIQSRDDLAESLARIEAELTKLQASAARIDADIAAAKRARAEVTRRGKELFALLQQVRHDLKRQDTLIQDCIDDIASKFIGIREGVYLLNGGGYAISQSVIGGQLCASLLPIVDSG